MAVKTTEAVKPFAKSLYSCSYTVFILTVKQATRFFLAFNRGFCESVHAKQCRNA